MRSAPDWWNAGMPQQGSDRRDPADLSPAILTPIIALITVDFLERSTRARKRKREASDGEERTGIV
jgi:hypothetical protein